MYLNMNHSLYFCKVNLEHFWLYEKTFNPVQIFDLRTNGEYTLYNNHWVD